MGSVALGESRPAPLAVGGDLLGAMLDGGLQPMYLCMAGSCGRCRCTVRQGLELLEPPNRTEERHGCTGPERLACQARLAADGDVVVSQG